MVASSANERFRKLRLLGEGATSHVYEVEDRLHHGRFALKQLRSDYFAADRIARFKDEFRQFQHISHPNLAKNYELISDDTGVYVLMELVEGVDFLEYVRSGSHSRVQPRTTQTGDPVTSRAGSRATTFGGVLCLERLRAVLPQLVGGLSALHAAHKVHCDIKPENVLVTPAGRVVIVDFGSATDAARRPGDRRGTPDFMAPEQFAGVSSEAVDWYAVGVLMYCALSGRLPIADSSYSLEHAKRYCRPVDPRIQATGLPDDLVRLSLRLLEVDASARPCARDIARELECRVEIAVVAPLRFGGRGRELRRLHSAVHASASDARVLWVNGETGSGKTTLLSRFVTAIETRGGAVFRGACYADARVRYGALDGVADKIASRIAREPIGLDASERSALAALFPVFSRSRRAALELVPAPDPVLVRARAVLAFRKLLERLAERTSVVVWIDDFQWTDDESIDLLSEILDAPPPRGVLFIFSHESSLDGRSERIRRARAKLPCDEELTLPPLEPAALRTILTAAGPVAASELDSLVRESCGNPFLANELVRARLSGIPCTSLDALLTARIERLEPKHRAYLELVAAAPQPVNEWVLQVALGVSNEVALDARRALLAASLIRVASGRDRGVEPYHERIRTHVLDQLRPRLGRQRRALVAAVLDASSHAGASATAASDFTEEMPASDRAPIISAKMLVRVLAQAISQYFPG